MDMELANIDTLSAAFVQSAAKGVVTRLLGDATGSRAFYVNIDTVPPGAYSAKYHAHTLQEEFFLVLEGSGRLRFDGGERPVVKGDFLSKSCGHAHCFYNDGARPLVLLDIGVRAAGDVCFYPDEDVCLLRDGGKAFDLKTALPGWNSDPNL